MEKRTKTNGKMWKSLFEWRSWVAKLKAFDLKVPINQVWWSDSWTWALELPETGLCLFTKYLCEKLWGKQAHNSPVRTKRTDPLYSKMGWKQKCVDVKLQSGERQIKDLCWKKTCQSSQNKSKLLTKHRLLDKTQKLQKL